MKKTTNKKIQNQSSKRIKKNMQSYRLCGNDMDCSLEDCDEWIKHDIIWRDEAIKNGEFTYSLPAAEKMLGRRMKIKQELIRRQSQ